MRNRDDADAIEESLPEPPVSRPRGAAWRALQADGVVWEGQVYLLGADVDLAARLIVTHRGIAFARGGDIVLEAPRAWLRPAPFLRRNGSVVISISAPAARYGAQPDLIAIRMRDGHPAAGHLIAMLAGSGARRIPADLDGLGAAILPALPSAGRSGDPFIDDDWAARPSVFHEPPRWADDAPVDLAPAASVPSSSAPRPLAASSESELEPVVRQPAAPVASGRHRDWNLPFGETLAPRGQRRHRWSWALRLTGLLLLLATAAAFGAGRLPVSLDAIGPSIGRPAPTAAPAPTTGAIADDPNVAAAQTAVALGVGGQDGSLAATHPIVLHVPASGDAAPSAPTAAPPPAVIQSASAERWPTPPAPQPAATEPDAAPDAADEQPAAPDAAATEPDAVAPAAAPAVAETAAVETSAAEAAAPPATDATANTTPQMAQPPAAEALAYTVRFARGGPSLPAFGLPPTPGVNWMAVIVDVQNTRDAAVEAPVSQFRLSAADGIEAAVDPSSDLAASLAGIDSPYGPDGVVTLAPGAAQRLVLLFQIDPAASDLMLLAGDRSIPLGEALASGVALGDLPAEPSAS
ncbi:MAG: hypothetical protein IT337_13990 [Thermomicrobiales bacterium]|nr:hypothetical protein [Thermomicrobiales bacterium]